ncbi:MAG TPA: PAS domain S-box protein [Pyrinomonadaceae bacterium]|nr:PAS domain S-box protein [Pyrinomonadaceae bacterium]
MNSTTILVVDDTLDLLELYSLWLRQAGYKVLQACTGRECLRLVAEELPDLVLLDVMLPDIDGIEVCKAIKSNEQTAAIPVINVSGRRTSADNQVESLEAGADGYLTKPFEARSLLAHVRALLRMKQTEEALKRSEERFRAAFDNALDAMLIADDDGTYLDANPSACAMFGVSTEEILQRNLSDFVEPGRHREVEKAWQSFIEEGEQSGEFRLYRPDGTTRELEYRAKARFLPNRHLSILRDITQRKHAEEELRLAHAELEKRVEQRTAELIASNTFLKSEIVERQQAQEALAASEEKYRDLFENAKDAIYVQDIRGNYVSVNRAAEELSGYRRDEIVGKHFADFVAPEYLDCVNNNFNTKLKGRSQTAYELEVISRDGRRIPIELNSSTIFKDGVAVGIQGMARDITDRKRVEAALRQSEEQYRELVENINDIIYATDENGVITYISRAVEQAIGLSPSEMIGQSFTRFLYPADEKLALQNFQQSAAGISDALEFRVVDKSGAIRWVRKSSRPVFHGDLFMGTRGLVSDITERKEAEAARMHLLQRLVTAQEEEQRRLSRELHDQTGQSLAALMLGLKSIEDSDQLKEGARNRLRQLQDLTSQLARDVHHLASNLRPTALDDLGLHTALSNYVEEWSDRTKICADFHSNGLMKERLPRQIETAVYRVVQEALTNVVKHANAQNVSVILEYRGNRVQAIIEDDGSGFDTERIVSARNSDGRLGLLGMQERVALVEGHLNIESAPASGTTVIVHIPVSGEQSEADTK